MLFDLRTPPFQLLIHNDDVKKRNQSKVWWVTTQHRWKVSLSFVYKRGGTFEYILYSQIL